MKGNLITRFNFSEFLLKLWCGRLIIAGCCSATLIIGSFNLSNAQQLYSISWVLTPNSVNSKALDKVTPADKVSLNFEHLTELLVPIHEFIMLFKSKEVSELLMKDEDLVKKVFQSEWDAAMNTFAPRELTDLDILKAELKKTIMGDPVEQYIPPNAARLAVRIGKTFTFKEIDNTGFIEIRAISSNPKSTVMLMEKIKHATDKYLYDREVSQINKSISFLNLLLSSRNDTRNRKGIAALLVEEEIKLSMLEIYAGGIFETISGPTISVQSIALRAQLTLAFYFTIGFLIGLLLLFIKRKQPYIN